MLTLRSSVGSCDRAEIATLVEELEAQLAPSKRRRQSAIETAALPEKRRRHREIQSMDITKRIAPCKCVRPRWS